MDRRGVAVLVAALVASLTAIAFLLGRESSRDGAEAPAPVRTAADPRNVPPDSPPEAAAEEDGASAPSDTETPASTEPTALAESTEEAVTEPMRADVGHYFEQMDAIQAEAKSTTGDPKALAEALLKQATSGDLQGLDALLETQRGLLARLRAVSAPPPAAAHLQQSVAAVEDGLRLLERTRDALANQDVGGLGTLTAQGQDLERRARAVDAEGAALKSRYGL
jgi:hypothetical protein